MQHAFIILVFTSFKNYYKLLLIILDYKGTKFRGLININKGTKILSIFIRILGKNKWFIIIV